MDICIKSICSDPVAVFNCDPAHAISFQIILGPSKCRQFAAKPLAAKPNAATFFPLTALLLTAGHLQQNRTLAAKPLAVTTCTNNLQRKRSLAATICREIDHWQLNYLQRNRRLAAEPFIEGKLGGPQKPGRCR